jgi:hypothetical protein
MTVWSGVMMWYHTGVVGGVAHQGDVVWITLSNSAWNQEKATFQTIFAEYVNTGGCKSLA